MMCVERRFLSNLEIEAREARKSGASGVVLCLAVIFFLIFAGGKRRRGAGGLQEQIKGEPDGLSRGEAISG
jgi:hypothetical protein